MDTVPGPTAFDHRAHHYHRLHTGAAAFGHAGTAIAVALKVNAVLSELFISGNEISRAGKKVLQEIEILRGHKCKIYTSTGRTRRKQQADWA